MKPELATLYYVHDPMCSWCWGFRPVWQEVKQALSGQVNIQNVLGGLAADAQETMPQEMQQSIRGNWQRIQQEIPGTVFNYDFWSICKPRRSTYPACRAVIAAGFQGQEYADKMLFAIQQAYYLKAKNPSDYAVLKQLSRDIGLNAAQFEKDLNAVKCEDFLNLNLQLTSRLNVTGFPSLVLASNKDNALIYIDYNDSEVIVSEIKELIQTHHK